MKYTRAFAYALYMMISSYFMSVRDVMPEEIKSLKEAYILDAIKRTNFDIEEKCMSYVTEVIERVLPWNCYLMEADVCILELGDDEIRLSFQMGGISLELTVLIGECLADVRCSWQKNCTELEMCA